MVFDNLVDAGQVANSSSLDWTLIILSLAVAVSLVIGIWNIVLTKNAESRRYKYEVLNEICNWLEKVMICGGEVNVRFMKLPKVTPAKQKEIVEEAIARYYIISSRVDFVSKISVFAGIQESSFKIINDGIIDVMEAIDEQLGSGKFNVLSLFTDHIKPLDESCSDLMGQIALALGKEVKLKP